MIACAHANAIAEIIIDNPPVNALGPSIRSAFLDAIVRAEQDELVRALVGQSYPLHV
jgi:3-hydroxyacyl-CoA dehydrogenase